MTGVRPVVLYVFELLQEHCGCDPELWPEFAAQWPACIEFRFQGQLGFGGKIWANNGRVYVTCYPEDETPARKARIDAANRELGCVHV